MNEEFLVSACHQQALNTFLVFVHTARRCYRLNGSMSSKEFDLFWLDELPQIVSFRGSKSRNKVSVGEPADGSLQLLLFFGSEKTFFWIKKLFSTLLLILYFVRYILSIGLPSNPRHLSRGKCGQNEFYIAFNAGDVAQILDFMSKKLFQNPK